MTVSLELEGRLADKVREYCQQHELLENELVDRLLRDFLVKQEQGVETPFELWQRVFSAEGSGKPDLGSRAKKHLREKLHGKYSD